MSEHSCRPLADLQAIALPDLPSGQFICLIGLPGSGKSWLAANLSKPDRQIVSTDAIRARLFGDESIQGDWRSIWREVKRQFATAAAQNLCLIYDATNVRRSIRREVMAAAAEAGFTQITGIWLDVPLDICLARNAGRSRQVPEVVIARMHRQLQGAPPHVSEGMTRLVRFRGGAAASDRA